MSLDVSGPLIGRLWERNPGLVQQFLGNRFCKLQAEGEESETLPSYRYYSVVSSILGPQQERLLDAS